MISNTEIVLDPLNNIIKYLKNDEPGQKTYIRTTKCNIDILDNITAPLDQLNETLSPNGNYKLYETNYTVNLLNNIFFSNLNND